MELDANLTLIRPQNEDRPLASVNESVEVVFVSETDVQAFPENVPEQCVVPVVKVPAVLLTPTCNLREDYWLFSPLHSVAANTSVNRRVLHSTTKGYADLFGIYAHPKGLFEESFISFHDVVSVPSEPFRHYQESRVISLSKESQRFLEDKLARFLSRGWGYAPHEKVETAGFYQCKICTRYYGLPEIVVFLNAGDHPPKCRNCDAIKQTASWELLQKHKRSRPLKEIPPVPSLFTRALRFFKLTRA